MTPTIELCVSSTPSVFGPMPETQVIDLDELTRRTNRTAIQVSALKMMIVWPLFAAGAILALACAGQGIENSRAVQVAYSEDVQ